MKKCIDFSKMGGVKFGSTLCISENTRRTNNEYLEFGKNNSFSEGNVIIMKLRQTKACKRILQIFILCILISIFFVQSAFSQNIVEKSVISKLDKENFLILKYRDDYQSENTRKLVMKNLNIKESFTIKKIDKAKIEILQFENFHDTNRLIEEFKKDKNVEDIQANLKVYLDAIPSDFNFTEQWGLYNSGQTILGITGHKGNDINIIPAWNVTTGSKNIYIGVLDTGIDIEHKDLVGNIYIRTYAVEPNKWMLQVPNFKS